MKKILLIVVVAFAMAFCSCAQSVSLSERAIVKCIYIDETDNIINAALVIYTCEPSANTAQVQGDAKVYVGEGETIGQAILNAEQKQKRKPFYNQNKVILIGSKASENASKYLAYFKAQEEKTVNMGAFLIDKTIEDITKLEKNFTEILEMCETMLNTDASASGGNKTKRVCELTYNGNDEFYGYLPILKMEDDTPIGVESLALYNNGVQACVLEELQMQLTLLLSNKLKTLSFSVVNENGTVLVKTKPVYINRKVNNSGVLEVLLTARLEETIQSGKALYGQDLENVLSLSNSKIMLEGAKLVETAFMHMNQNDIFKFNWWCMHINSVSCSDVLVKSNLSVVL